MKTVLITGTSSGIGLETAALLALRGYSVIATMRNFAKRAALETRLSELGATAEILELDAQSDTLVAAAIASVIGRHAKIDALVSNAGAGHLGVMEQTPLKDAMRVMDQKFWSAWRMTTAVMPAMRAAGHQRLEHRRLGRTAVQRRVLRGEIRARGDDGELRAARSQFRCARQLDRTRPGTTHGLHR